MISIAFFNFAGVSVTKELSATTRMVLDSVRTLVIWSASLMLHWQKFYWPQVQIHENISEINSVMSKYYRLGYFRLLDLFCWCWAWACTTISSMLQCASANANLT